MELEFFATSQPVESEDNDVVEEFDSVDAMFDEYRGVASPIEVLRTGFARTWAPNGRITPTDRTLNMMV